jgi:16S rRNA A1518/A1519 N6-dimethyltransferase RsmA/KsgA/DIM1 with predicted DNA glycosylase/AP lyase activity
VPGHVASGSPSRRRLGQHFLDSSRLAARLVADAAIGRDDRVVDLGAGTGLLTAALADRAGSVLAIELDTALVHRLAKRFDATANVVVLHADLGELPLPSTPYRVVANPPFAAAFNPRPSVDAGILTVSKRDRPCLPPEDFGSYAAFVGTGFAERSDAPQVAMAEWVDQFRTRRQSRRRGSRT